VDFFVHRVNQTMNIKQHTWTTSGGWRTPEPTLGTPPATLILAFGARQLIADGAVMREVQAAYPNAQIVGCSTAGTIAGTHISDDTITITAISFDHTPIRVAQAPLATGDGSVTCGEQLAAALRGDDLVHVLVLSDGLNVNGGELARGLGNVLPRHVAVTGGLSGDGASFRDTLVYCNGSASDRRAVAIGFYGTKLRVGYGSLGGWDTFGPERVVTRAHKTVLYELDGESALALYKRYLGEHAMGLPASALRFPLSIKSGTSEPLVRTILAVDEKEQSMTFAGDIPEGVHARLMRANVDRLIDGATGAAVAAQSGIGENVAELALLISCVGRKLVLQQRTEEEVESVRAVVGDRAAMTGFYSYGEIAPFGRSCTSELHNQTMTVTLFSEAG
jgi:hypothetical protein